MQDIWKLTATCVIAGLMSACGASTSNDTQLTVARSIKQNGATILTEQKPEQKAEDEFGVYPSGYDYLMPNNKTTIHFPPGLYHEAAMEQVLDPYGQHEIGVPDVDVYYVKDRILTPRGKQVEIHDAENGLTFVKWDQNSKKIAKVEIYIRLLDFMNSTNMKGFDSQGFDAVLVHEIGHLNQLTPGIDQATYLAKIAKENEEVKANVPFEERVTPGYAAQNQFKKKPTVFAIPTPPAHSNW